MTRNLLKWLLPILLIAAGVVVFVGLQAMNTPTQKVVAAPAPTSVHVVTVQGAPAQAQVETSGTVRADREITLMPEVSGRITEVGSGFLPGTRVRAGEALFSIDAREYRFAVAAEEARVAQANLELQLERRRGEQARREWALLGNEGTQDALSQRQPHLEVAEANLEAAEASLARARLNLQRTQVRAPFDAVVITESVDVGQLVTPQMMAGRLIGTDAFRVDVSVPVSRLGLLGLGTGTTSAKISQRLSDGQTLEATGEVLELVGELNAESRTATVLVRINHPWDQAAASIPILPGAFVEVQLLGSMVDTAFQIPRSALIDGRQVRVASPDDTLEFKTVSVAFSDREFAWVDAGLADGDRVIITPLSLPIEGMALDVTEAAAEGE
ncbi:MAG: efflux RND transporter periplasmic adaptor subunit [Myxococcota bacterium]